MKLIPVEIEIIMKDTIIIELADDEDLATKAAEEILNRSTDNYESFILGMELTEVNIKEAEEIIEMEG